MRRYSSSDPPEPLVEGRNTPDYWIRPHQPLSAKAGFHRFVWDVHHERPAVPAFQYPIAAIYRNTPRAPFGSWALPGNVHGAAHRRRRDAHRSRWRCASIRA